MPPPPDPEHVHVGGSRVLEDASVVVQIETSQDGIAGNPVGSLGEEGNTVGRKAEGLAPGVGLAQELQGAKPDAPGPGVDHLTRSIA